jgi:hypothetical protein
MEPGAGENKRAYQKRKLSVSYAQPHIHDPPACAKESIVRVHDMNGGDTGRGDIVENEEQPNLLNHTLLLTSGKCKQSDPSMTPVHSVPLSPGLTDT